MLGCVRLPDGGWNDFFVKDPSGHQIKLYLSIDKSPKQLRKEREGKRLFNLVKEQLTQAGKAAEIPKLSLLRKDAVVSHNWRPVAKVVVAEKRASASTVRCILSEMARIGLDRKKLTDSFFETVASGPDPTRVLAWV